MASYTFETITAAQALAFSSADSLTIASGSAKTTTVLFQADGTFSITVPDRTLIFSSEFQYLNTSRLRYPDGSELYIGTSSADVRNLGGIPSAGGAIYAGDGNDSITSNPADWLIQGNQGDDRITAYAQALNTIYGGQGNDTVQMTSTGTPSGRQFVQGNKGNDTLQGGNGGDTILGGQGSDVLMGGGGQDFINGNLGDDNIGGDGQLYGEGGDDLLIGLGTLSGGDGNDILRVGTNGVPANNFAYGDAGDDTISASSDTRDEIYGGDGNDRISMIQDSRGVSSAKLIDGGTGNDTLIGRGSQETLVGGNGRDSLSGNDAADILNGGLDADTLNGGAGADTLSGGDGLDFFVFQDRPSSNLSGDIDLVLDWSVEDRIDLLIPAAGYVEGGAGDLASALALAKATLADGFITVAVIQIPDGLAIYTTGFEVGQAGSVATAALLVGRTLADISASNFI